MYRQFYGFREKPFSLLPDPEFLFLSDKHEKALNLLELGIHNQSGFCVISGEIGAGKTTLVRELLNRLDERVCTGLIANTHSTFSDLLGWILAAYELKCESNEAVVQHRCFSDFVIAQYAQGKHTLLIIDEAQNLSLSALEQLRMLSNINSDKDLVLQVILIGQSELRAKLQQPELEQFAQRIAIDYHLTALDQEETSEYIQHRVTKSGCTQQLFDTDACRLVYQRSGGIPRLINRICDLSLVYGFSEKRKVIDVELIKAVTAQQKMEPLIEPLEEKPAAARVTPPDSATRPLKTTSVQKAAHASIQKTDFQPQPSSGKNDKKQVDNRPVRKTAELKQTEKAADSKPARPLDKQTGANPTQETSQATYTEAEKATASKARAESIFIEKDSAASTLVEKSRADATTAEKADHVKLTTEKEAAEKVTASQTAATLAEASVTAAKLAETEKLTAEKAVRKATSAAEQAARIIADKKQKAENLVAEKTRIEKAALQDATAAKTAAEKAVAERIAAEKAAAETETVAEAAVKKAAANRAAAEKVAASMVHDSETAAARTLSIQADAERTAAEKIAAEKAAAEKARADAALAKKAATETAAATSAAQEKAAAAKQAVEKAAASHAAAEKALAERVTADTIAKQKASLEKIALAKVAASVAAAAQQAADKAAEARIAAQKEASDKEAVAVAAAKKAAEASALAEAAAADSVTAQTNTSDLQLVEKPEADSHSPAVDQQPPDAMQAQIQAARTRTTPRRIRSFFALSAISAVVAASSWLVTRHGDMGTTLSSLVVAGQSFANSQPVTEAAALETGALEPVIEASESRRQP